MIDIPILQRRQPSTPAPDLDAPIHVKSELIGGSGPNVMARAQHIRSSVDDDRFTKIDLAQARGVYLLLNSHYRGHFWEVTVDTKQGYCAITIPILLGIWKWKMPLQDMTPAMVIKAGGEILERFNIPRSTLDVPAFVEARKQRVSRASQKPPS